MAAIFTERTMNPETQEQVVKIKHTTLKTAIFFEGTFFVVGRSNTGARYYSDTIKEWDAANKIFADYCDVISYFGGGNVELFCMNGDGYDIVYSKNI